MRGIPLPVHSAVEVVSAPAIMAAPFALGFGAGATAACVAIGAVLLGLALQADAPSRAIPLTAHAGFDYALAAAAALSGVVVGAASGEWYAMVFLVGVGAAMVALTASTRFSSARSA